MFVTNPSYEAFFPPGLSSPGERHFRAFDISVRIPWFLITLKLFDAKDSVYHTVCCSHSQDVDALLLPTDQQLVTAIEYVMPVSAGGFGWSSHSVVRIWRDTGEPDGAPDALLFELSDNQALYNAFGTDTKAATQSLKLVVDFKAAATNPKRPPRGTALARRSRS
ncbi:MAG: hypothetical protein Tsb007_15520 [Rhizobacter sp.]